MADPHQCMTMWDLRLRAVVATGATMGRMVIILDTTWEVTVWAGVVMAMVMVMAKAKAKAMGVLTMSSAGRRSSA